LVCAIAAGLVSFAWPDQYVSSALLRFLPRYVPEQELEERKLDLGLRPGAMHAEVLGRTSLTRIIQSPGIDLYARERRSSPMEDVIETMRKQVSFRWNVPAETFSISFEYPDARKVQRVVRALVTALVDANERINRSPAQANLGSPSAEYLDIVDEASLPEKSAGPDRYAIAEIGLAAGFVLGVVGFAMRRISKRQALRMTVAALGGFAVAAGVTFLLPDDRFADLLSRLPFAGLGAAAGLLVWAVLRGGRAAWRRPHYGWSALAGGALGAIAAGLLAYVIPAGYESTAMLLMHAAVGTMTPEADAPERLAEITDEVLSRSSLSELVTRPSLDLYPGERQGLPMEEIIGNMRANDLRIGNTAPGPILRVLISFTYADRFKAQAVVREIVTKFTEGNAVIERRQNRGETRAGTIVTEAWYPASLPEEPLFPQSAATMAAAPRAGALLAWMLALMARAASAGALLAWVLAFLRRRPPGQAAAMLKMGAAGGAAGALLAGAIAFAIPARYVSTAVLRIHPGTGQKISARHVADYVRQETEVILSRSNLTELMQRSELDLYHGERARHPMEQVIDKMREDLRIEPPAPARLTTPFSVAFTYTDRTKAQAVVSELASRFVESQTNYVKETPGFGLDLTDEARLEVLDPASLPETPAWPPRGGIVAGGLLAGLLLGLAAVHIFARERAAGTAALGHQDLVDAADAFLEAERRSGQP
jgi:uncharacterized protein involved in exopolysaccharide biosynthesis